ncbi:hypothetical protein D3C80_1920660 [compost metagenome]
MLAMWARPSAWPRSQPSLAASIRKRLRGLASPTWRANASVPNSRMKLSGSCSEGRNRNFRLRVSVA